MCKRRTRLRSNPFLWDNNTMQHKYNTILLKGKNKFKFMIYNRNENMLANYTSPGQKNKQIMP